MKKSTLQKITNGKYYVEDCCTYTKDGTMLSNFYIKDLSINRCVTAKTEVNISFTVKLKSGDDCSTATLPIVYLYEPYGWLHMRFDIEEYEPKVSKEKFNLHFNNIIKSIQKKQPSNKEYIIGWETNDVKADHHLTEFFDFAKYDDNSEYVDEKDVCETNVWNHYLGIIPKGISIPLFLYGFLATTMTMLITQTKHRPDFIMSITGGDSISRSKLALFYTNFYRRNLYLYKQDYRDIHIFPEDSMSEIYFKTAVYKDSTLIAFEPQKKKCNNLEKLYNNSNTDVPCYNLCLITQTAKEDIPFKTINVNIDGIEFKSILESHFDSEDMDYAEDRLMDTIYSCIYKLTQKLQDHKDYILNMRKEAIIRLAFGKRFQSLSEEAQECISYLYFSYLLFSDLSDQEPLQITEAEVKEIIFDLALNSYPNKDDATKDNINNAFDVCRVIDEYVKKNKNTIGIIGEHSNGRTKVWVDDSNYYISLRDIKEILKIQNKKIAFSTKEKMALAQKEIIKTITTKNETVEYSVHIQKPLYDNYKTRNRYLAFDIAKCKEYGLFTELLNATQRV